MPAAHASRAVSDGSENRQGSRTKPWRWDHRYEIYQRRLWTLREPMSQSLHTILEGISIFGGLLHDQQRSRPQCLAPNQCTIVYRDYAIYYKVLGNPTPVSATFRLDHTLQRGPAELFCSVRSSSHPVSHERTTKSIPSTPQTGS